MIFKFHSVIDLITNSSTVIYTYSGASLEACREMIDEVFKSLNVDKKCDDVFMLTVLADEDTYEQWLSDHQDEDEEDDEDDDEDDEEEEEEDEEEEAEGEDEKLITTSVSKLMDDIMYGRAEKPAWMVEAEEEEDDVGFTQETTLHIVAKDPAFENLAKLVSDFLYSTHHEATRDG
jgi:GTPase SAR1 family protein